VTAETEATWKTKHWHWTLVLTNGI